MTTLLEKAPAKALLANALQTDSPAETFSGDMNKVALPAICDSQAEGPSIFELAPLNAAIAASLVTPTSEKGPDAANVEGPGQTKTHHSIFAQPADDGKRFSTLRAELARQAFCLHGLADGSYLATRWNCCRPLADLREVAAFLRQVGAANG